MLVARSFRYGSSKQPQHLADRDREKNKDPVRGFGWRPQSFKTSNFRPPSSPPSTSSHEDERTPVASPTLNPIHAPPTLPTPSKPVAVPSRSRPSTPHDAPPPSRQHQSRLPHDPNALSPSVAALLAMTSIPQRKTQRQPSSNPRSTARMSLDELVREWKQPDHQDKLSLGSSPTMEFLLSPPQDPQDSPPIDDPDTYQPSSPSRSASNESMPSLDTDSINSMPWQSPPTPDTSIKGDSDRPRKRDVSLSTPASVECHTDHPLHPTTPPPSPPLPSQQRSTDTLTAPRPTRQPSRQKRLPKKSNLTASLRALTRSISSLALPAPALQDDHLTRALVGPSPPFSPEKRPRPLSGPPSPALRRYLNPSHHHDFHLHLQEDLLASPLPLDLDDHFELTHMTGGAAPVSATDTEAGRIARGIDVARQREPRENPEFLRIAVLELAMRRAGKVDARAPLGFAAPGRRGWLLPPRAVDDCVDARGSETVGGQRLGHVPARWRGELA